MYIVNYSSVDRPIMIRMLRILQCRVRYSFVNFKKKKHKNVENRLSDKNQSHSGDCRSTDLSGNPSQNGEL